jgi:hypothetical protein
MTLPGYNLIWEPVSLGSNPEARRYGFYPDTYLPSGANDPSKEAYLHSIVSGANLSTNILSHRHFSLVRLLACRGWLIKLVRGNLLLPWLLDRYPVKGILLIRHPCAVVSSQLQWAWKAVKEGHWRADVKQGVWRFPPSLSANYPHLSEVYRTIETLEEYMAFDWALQTYIPLSQPKPHPWYLTTYEGLVREGTQEVDNIFQYLKHRVPQEAYRCLNTQSATVHPDSYFAHKGDPLAGWRFRLDAHQVRKILHIVHRVGIDFYDEALLPDYDALSAWK